MTRAFPAHLPVLARILAALAVAALVLLGSPAIASASAASVPVTVPAQVGNTIADDTSSTNTCGRILGAGSSSASDALPINRWRGGTTELHTYLDTGLLGTDAVGQSMQRDGVTGAMMSATNSLWGFGWTLTDIAVNFCPLDMAGASVDEAVGGIGRILIPEGSAPVLLTGVIAIAMAVALYRSRRSGISYVHALKEGAGKTVVIGLMVVMMAGAAASTGGGPNGNYNPGKFSPGWVVSTLNSTMSTVASIPSELVLTEDDHAALNASNNVMQCDRYLSALHTSYRGQAPAGLGAQASVPLAMSMMWEDSVLQAWKNIQYGTNFSGPDNPADWAYCHQLEWSAPVQAFAADAEGREDQARNWAPQSATVSMAMARAVDGKIGNAYDRPSAAIRESVREAMLDNGRLSQAFAPTSESNADRSLFAWSQCGRNDGGRWIANPHVAGRYDGKEFSAEECEKWFTGTGDVPAHFETAQDVNTVSEKSDNTQVANYINTVHGYEGSEGITIGFALTLASLVMVVVFGALALAVILAKVLMVLLALGLFVALIRGLLPGNTFAPFFKMLIKTLGVVVLVFLVQVLFSLVVSLSQTMASAGVAMVGAGTFMGAIWTGLAPAVVVIGLHFLFKQLKMPSPFNPAAGLAWGKALSDNGGSAMASGAAGALNRWEHRQMGRGKAMARSAGRSMANRVTPGRGSGSAAAERRGSVAGTIASTAAGTALGNRVGDMMTNRPGGEGSTAAGIAGAAGSAPEREAGRGGKGPGRLSDAALLRQRAGLAGDPGMTSGGEGSHAVTGDNAKVPNSALAGVGATRAERDVNRANAKAERRAALTEHRALQRQRRQEAGQNVHFAREAARRGVTTDQLKASGWTPADRGRIRKGMDAISGASRAAWANKGKVAAVGAGAVAATALAPALAGAAVTAGVVGAATVAAVSTTKGNRQALRTGVSALGEAARNTGDRITSLRDKADVSDNRFMRAMGAHSDREMDQIVKGYRSRDAEIRNQQAHEAAKSQSRERITGQGERDQRQGAVGMPTPEAPMDEEYAAALAAAQDAQPVPDAEDPWAAPQEPSDLEQDGPDAEVSQFPQPQEQVAAVAVGGSAGSVGAHAQDAPQSTESVTGQVREHGPRDIVAESGESTGASTHPRVEQEAKRGAFRLDDSADAAPEAPSSEAPVAESQRVDAPIKPAQPQQVDLPVQSTLPAPEKVVPAPEQDLKVSARTEPAPTLPAPDPVEKPQLPAPVNRLPEPPVQERAEPAVRVIPTQETRPVLPNPEPRDIAGKGNSNEIRKIRAPKGE